MAASQQDQIANLKTTIDELRRVYDWLCNAYGEVKVKILTFIGGDLAVLTFLYSDGNTFIPKQTYGQVFYFIGLGLTILGLGYLFSAIRPKYWEFPTEHKDLEKMDFDSELEYLDYVKERYLYCYNIDIKVYEDKQKLLNTSFYLLIFGAIILTIIKVLGG